MNELFIFVVVISVIGIAFNGLGLYLSNQDKKKNKEPIIEKNVSLKDTLDELDYFIAFYIDDYLFRKTITGENIFMNDKILNTTAISISSKIILNMSDMFKNKVLLFLTENAYKDYITRKVMKELIGYANTINKPQ